MTAPLQRLAGLIGVPAGYIERDGALDPRRLYETLISIGRRPDNFETIPGALARHFGPEASSLAWEALCPHRKPKPQTKGTPE